MKDEVLRTAEAALGPHALLATNTSSMSVGELAAVVDRPERFLGLRWRDQRALVVALEDGAR